MNIRYPLMIAALLTLTACGTDKTDRTLGGAAVGAGAGALIGSAVGAPGYGALVGAGTGALVGGLTDAEHINLGKPWWK